jgi:hypothetical protein
MAPETAGDYTKWPEVKALPAVADEPVSPARHRERRAAGGIGVRRSPRPEVVPEAGKLTSSGTTGPEMRKDVREFIRRLEAVGLTVESTPGHYRVLREGKPLRRANGMPFTLPFSPDTIRWRRAAIVELRKLGIDL